MRCILQQDEIGWTLRPIRYWSLTLHDSNQQYNTTQLECLSVVWAALLLRPHIECSRFIVRTNNRAQKCILHLKEIWRRFVRWRLRPVKFELYIVRRAGIIHQAADEYFHFPTTTWFEERTDDDIPIQWMVHHDKRDNLGGSRTKGVFQTKRKWTVWDTASRPRVFIAIAEFFKAQKAESFCARLAATVGELRAHFDSGENGLLWPRATIDG